MKDKMSLFLFRVLVFWWLVPLIILITFIFRPFLKLNKNKSLKNIKDIKGFTKSLWYLS